MILEHSGYTKYLCLKTFISVQQNTFKTTSTTKQTQTYRNLKMFKESTYNDIDCSLLYIKHLVMNNKGDYTGYQ